MIFWAKIWHYQVTYWCSKDDVRWYFRSRPANTNRGEGDCFWSDWAQLNEWRGGYPSYVPAGTINFHNTLNQVKFLAVCLRNTEHIYSPIFTCSPIFTNIHLMLRNRKIRKHVSLGGQQRARRNWGVPVSCHQKKKNGKNMPLSMWVPWEKVLALNC